MIYVYFFIFIIHKYLPEDFEVSSINPFGGGDKVVCGGKTSG